MTSAFSWQNSISLCPASLRIARPNLPVTPGVSWLPTFAFQSPIMKSISFLCVLVLEGHVSLQRTIQQYHSNPSLCPKHHAEDAEQFCEDLQDLLELTHKKDVLFITGDWNAKVRTQQIPGETGKCGLGAQNEAGQRLIEFCQENALVIANTLFQQHKRRLYTRT